MDAIDHPKPQSSTEGSVLGPFHSHEAELVPSGGDISSDPKGDPCLVLCTVKDPSGNPIEGVKIDIWETDSSGHYDVQYSERDGPDGRVCSNNLLPQQLSALELGHGACPKS